MFSSFAQETVSNFRLTNSLRSLSEILADVTNRLGFDYYAIAQSNSSRTDVGPLVAFNYPADFMQQQAETSDFRHSPVLAAVKTNFAPFLWSDLPEIIDFQSHHKDYLENAAKFGLRHGYTIPIHQPGEPSGFVTFVKNSDTRPDPEALPAAYFIGTHAFSAGRRIRDIEAGQPRGHLGDEDRKIISFVARGKSKLFIARKLQLSELEVAESLSRTRKYYRVGSQTAAVVQALWDKSIGFEDVIG